MAEPSAYLNINGRSHSQFVNSSTSPAKFIYGSRYGGQPIWCLLRWISYLIGCAPILSKSSSFGIRKLESKREPACDPSPVPIFRRASLYCRLPDNKSASPSSANLQPAVPAAHAGSYAATYQWNWAAIVRTWASEYSNSNASCRKDL